MHMTEREYKDYRKLKKKIIEQIIDIMKYKLDYDIKNIKPIYDNLNKKSIKYLVYYYNYLVQKI